MRSVKEIFDKLGLPPEKLKERLKKDTELTNRCRAGIQLLNINQAGVDLIKATDKTEAIARFRETLSPETSNTFIAAMVDCYTKGVSDQDTVAMTLTGEKLPVRYKIAIDASSRDTWDLVYVAVTHQEKETLTQELVYMTDIFEAVLKGIDVCVSHVDANGVFRKSVGSWLRRFHLQDDDLVGENVFNVYPASLHPAIQAGLDGEVVNFIDSSIERELDGREWYVRSYFLPAKQNGAYLLTIDITDLHLTQRQLEQQALALQRSHDELTQFAQVVSHDLREPIRTIELYTELLIDRLEDQLDEKTKNYLQTITRSVERMQDLISDLSHYNHIRPSDTLQKVDLNHTMESVLGNLAGAIKESNADVAYSALPTLKTNGHWFTVLFQNLIGNAIKYRGTKQAKIVVTANEDQGVWTFRVSDNGIGIETRYQNRIFEMFRRLHTRDQYPGTGMGLAICKKIVSQWSGRIWVESTPDIGSTFSFTFLEAATSHKK